MPGGINGMAPGRVALLLPTGVNCGAVAGLCLAAATAVAAWQDRKTPLVPLALAIAALPILPATRPSPSIRG